MVTQRLQREIGAIGMMFGVHRTTAARWIDQAFAGLRERTRSILAAELGQIGIRVNGVNPDGVVRGSGIFEGAWGDDRARVYGIARDDLGKYYAGRTVLGHEVLPEHVADAVFVFCAGDLSLTTGTIVPVDSGVPMSFLR